MWAHERNDAKIGMIEGEERKFEPMDGVRMYIERVSIVNNVQLVKFIDLLTMDSQNEEDEKIQLCTHLNIARRQTCHARLHPKPSSDPLPLRRGRRLIVRIL